MKPTSFMRRVRLLVLPGALFALVILALACGEAQPTATPTLVPASASSPTVAPPTPTVAPPMATATATARPAPTATSVPPTPTSAPAPSPTAASMPAPTPTQAAAGVSVKASQHSGLGTILTDSAGRTLYLFTRDELGKSNCSGGCATAWPPLLTSGSPVAGEGVSADHLGTIARDDGTMQVTYNGWPLYYFAQDASPGEAKGQNVNNVWFAVSTFGGPVQNGARVKAAQHPELGTVLMDASGRVLYLYTRDEQNKSNCSGGCAIAWPPLLTVGAPAAGEGVTADRLATITREDGSVQVTYNGWPLYYYNRDVKPGDTVGQNRGNVWFAVSTFGGPVQNGAQVKAAQHPELGTILVDASGRVLYLFTRDEPGVSNCSGGCALNWPPLLTVGAPTAGEGATADLLGTTTRGDGSTQVTYNGWPLYYYAKDAKPGDATGQEVGDVWYVLSPQGRAVGAEAGTAMEPTPSPTPGRSEPGY